MKLRNISIFIEKIVTAASTDNAKLAFEVCGEIVKAIGDHKSGKKFALALGAFNAIQKYITHHNLNSNAYDYFREKSDWLPLDLMMSDFVLDAISNMPYESIKLSDNSKVIIKDVEGYHIGYIYNPAATAQSNSQGGKLANEPLWVKTEQAHEAFNHLTNLLWKNFGSNSVVLEQKKNIWGASFVFSIDEFSSIDSKKAMDVSEELKLYFSKDINRSLMFFGPPGTGKSTLARTICRNLNLRYLRVRNSNFDTLDNTSIENIIDILKPDAVIIDDFDRATMLGDGLEKLEFLRKNVKLVLATANNIDSFDPALLRPQRFDDLILVNAMDEEVVKHILGDEHMNVFDTVKDWPVAYIVEYKLRCSVMSEEKVKQTLLSLAERIENAQVRPKVDYLDGMKAAAKGIKTSSKKTTVRQKLKTGA